MMSLALQRERILKSIGGGILCLILELHCHGFGNRSRFLPVESFWELTQLRFRDDTTLYCSIY
jgi:hypothetical protein